MAHYHASRTNLSGGGITSMNILNVFNKIPFLYLKSNFVLKPLHLCTCIFDYIAIANLDASITAEVFIHNYIFVHVMVDPNSSPT